MRRLLATLGLIAVTTAVAGASAHAATAPTTLVIIKVTSVTTKVSTTDRAPKGVSKGDRFVFRDRLLNAARQFGKPVGARVGSDRGSMVLTSATTGTSSGVATLPGGTIRFGGAVGMSSATFRILGGTGRYAHARGILAVGAGDSPLNVYHLVLPVRSRGAFVSARPAAGRPRTTLVVTVRSQEIAEKDDDRPPTGPSKGDRILLHDRLVNVDRQFGRPRGAVVGFDEGVLVFTSANEARFTGVTTLPGGTLRIHGTVHLSGSSTVGVVDGGTGRYAHARGTIQIGAGTNPLNTYHLTLPPGVGGGSATI